MEPSFTIQCESTLGKKHSDVFYYCFKCKEVLCYDCLIIHLCGESHELNSLKRIDEALVEGKLVFTTLREFLLSLNDKTPSSFSTGNAVSKLLAQKEAEYLKLISSIQAQILDMQENLDQLFGLLKKKANQMNNDHYKKSLEVICSELGVIGDNWDTSDTQTKLMNLKTIPDFEKRSKELLTIIEKKETKFQTNGYKEKETKEISMMLDEIAIPEFTNWHKNQTEALKKRLKNQLIKIKKNLDDFSDNEEKEKEKESAKQPTIALVIPSIVFPQSSNGMIETNPNQAVCVSKEEKPQQLSPLQEEQVKVQNDDKMEITPDLPEQPQPQDQKEMIDTSSISLPNRSSISYKGQCLFSIRKKETQNFPEVFAYLNKKVVITQLTTSNFQKCFSSQFPYKNCKSINLGNSLLITGGCIDSILTNKTFLLKFDEKGNLILTYFKPMLFNRECHNILFLQNCNSVLICSGQMIKTTELISLDAPDLGWNELPTMNHIRANGTLLLLNDHYIYCIGGFDNSESAYTNGYECLNINNTTEGWRNVSVLENLAISTMGYIQLSKSSVLLIGGFSGGKKYSPDGFMFNVEDEGGNRNEAKIIKKENVLTKGVIFFSSPQFYQIEDEIVNFDFKQNLIVFNPLTQMARVIQ